MMRILRSLRIFSYSYSWLSLLLFAFSSHFLGRIVVITLKSNGPSHHEGGRLHFIEITSGQNKHGLLSKLVVPICSELVILAFNDRSLNT
jgi:hypothetical protein